LRAIKVSNNKIEVITSVSKPKTDLSTNFAALSDKFVHAFSNQHSQIAGMISRLKN
jgi:hypothetical protein